MRSKKFALLIALAFASAAALSAADKVTYDRPRSGEVVIVTRLVMTPGINDAFFSQYYGQRAGSITIEKSENKDGKPVASTSAIVVDNQGFGPINIGMGAIGSFFTDKVTLPRDRKISVRIFRAYPAALEIFKVVLPVFAEFTVPEGQNYVYLGTLVYNWEGPQFTITGAKKLDEFDKAEAVVKERYGADANLVRVPLKDMKS